MEHLWVNDDLMGGAFMALMGGVLMYSSCGIC